MSKSATGYLSFPLLAHQNISERSEANFPPVLDACCGPRMMWYDKNDARAIFVDNRSETVVVDKRPGESPDVVAPDVIADFRSLPFADETFWMVVFDPPHLTQASKGSYMVARYGILPLDWKNYLSRGFAECFRVLKPNGTLIFKWNETRIPVSQVVCLAPFAPLFGNKYGRQARSHWIAFLKHNRSA